MLVREPAVAGQFYAASSVQCQAEVEACLSRARSSADVKEVRFSSRPLGGVVPHAGWICSGAVAAEVISLLAEDQSVDTFVIFGAAHRPAVPQASVFAAGVWKTPLGEISIDEELAAAAVSQSGQLQSDSETHRFEHSIEVQVPFIQYLKPQARLLPVIVPPMGTIHEVGRVVAPGGHRFKRKGGQVNDRRMLELILQLKAGQVVDEARSHQNACGSGAVAAAIAACVESGADSAVLLQHTTSNEVLADRLGSSMDAVGYAGIVFGSKAS